MARNTFGKTWWGSEWLKSLTHIDFANRVPRGSTYARNGAVKSIDVDERVVEKAIVEKVKNFIMTLGRDFTFMGNLTTTGGLWRGALPRPAVLQPRAERDGGHRAEDGRL